MIRVWLRSSHDRAVRNARDATTECSRRRVEREDVELFLAARYRVAAEEPTTSLAR